MAINFSIPTALSVAGLFTVSGSEFAPSGVQNRPRWNDQILLTNLDSGALVQLIGLADGVTSLNNATGAVTLASGPDNAGYVSVSNSGTTIYFSGQATPSLTGVLLAGGGRVSGNAGNVYVSAPGSTLFVDGIVDARTAASAGTFSLGGSSVLSAASSTSLLINGGGYTNVLFANGNVGVGVAVAPTEKLHVSGGNFRVDGFGSFTGAVGIGTLAPSQKLEVVGGNIQIDNNRSLNGRTIGATSRSLIGSDASSFVYVGDSATWSGIRFYPGASEAMRVTSAGNVGIGSTNPGYKLEVSGTAAITSAIYGGSGIFFRDTGNYTASGAASVAQLLAASGWLTNASTSNVVYVTGAQTITGVKQFNAPVFWNSVGIGTTSPSTLLTLQQSVDTAEGAIRIQNVGNSNALRIWKGAGATASTFTDNGVNTMSLLGGLVGIGTTTPSGKLHILDGAAHILSQLTTPASTTANAGLSLGFDGNVENGWIQAVRNNVAEIRNLQIQPLGGNVRIAPADITSTVITSPRFTVSGDGLFTRADHAQFEVYSTALSDRNAYLFLTPATGFGSTSHRYSIAALGGGGLRFFDHTANLERMRLTNAGYLGIGTSSPSDPLHVTGSTLLAVNGGSVGVGTSAPQERLHVSGGNLRVDGSGLFAGSTTRVAVGFLTPTYRLEVSGDIALKSSAGTARRALSEGAADDKLHLGLGFNTVYTTAANLGVGSDTPSFKLHVSGDGGFTNSVTSSGLRLAAHTTTGGGIMLGSDQWITRKSADNLTFGVNGADAYALSNSTIFCGTSSTFILKSAASQAVAIQVSNSSTNALTIDATRRASFSSGLFFADTGNYTASGAASVAQLIGASGALQTAVNAGARHATHVTGNFTIAAPNYRYVWTGTAMWTGTMPTPAAASGAEFKVINASDTANLFLSGSIWGQTNYTMTPKSAATLWSDAGTWHLV